MRPLTRRRFVQSAAVVATTVSGAYALPRSVAADASISSFSTDDDYILTTDGSVSAVWATPSVELSWVGCRPDSSVEIDLAVVNPNTGVDDSIVEFQEFLGATNGSTTYVFDGHDVLTTAAFEAADFAVDEPGEIQETVVEFILDVAIVVDDQTTLMAAASNAATITVERLPGPVIKTFEVEDVHHVHTWVEVLWEVVDEDVELEAVHSELRFVGEDQLLDSATTQVSGSTATGTHLLQENDASEDGYEVTLIASNVDGVTTVETKLGDGASDPDPPGGSEFDVLNAAVTDSRGGIDEPTEVVFEYEISDGLTATVEFTMEVAGSVSEETVTGSAGSVTVQSSVPGPPSAEYATVTAAIPDGASHSTDIALADGEVDLLDG